MKLVKMLVAVLLILGGLNWGLVGLFEYNLVETLLGTMPMAMKIVYGLMGLSAILKLICLFSCCKSCSSEGSCGTEE